MYYKRTGGGGGGEREDEGLKLEVRIAEVKIVG